MVRRHWNICAFVTACALAFTVGEAAAQPTNLGPIPQRASLSDTDRGQVSNYVERWSDRLESTQSNTADTAKAARQLMDPAKLTTATSSFLSEYSRLSLPRLVTILQGNDTFKAVQAARVIGHLGTPDALEELLPWCNSATEQRDAVRLWASRGCYMLIKRTTNDNLLNERMLGAALRQIKQAAEDEENWLVLHRQFEALAAANTEAARQHQLDVFESVLRRLERSNNQPSDLMQALSRAMTSFRDQYLVLNQQERDRFGAALGPMLGKVFQVADAHWDAAKPQTKANESYGQAVQISEVLLRLIDQSLRAGSSSARTNLTGAWTTSDRTRFQSDMNTWMSVLQGPPYGR